MDVRLRRADHSYRGALLVVWVCVCDLETLIMGQPKPELGRAATERK